MYKKLLKIVPVALLLGATSLTAQHMRMDIQGYVYSAQDSFGSTYNYPNGVPYGTPFSLVFNYELGALGPDLDPSSPGQLYDNRPWQIYYSQPSDYPAFLSADLTISGITVAVDTRWWSKLDYKPGWNSLGITGKADRTALDPNGSQADEIVGFSMNLFGQAFDSGTASVYLNPTSGGSIGEVFARIFQPNDPLSQATGYYPLDRFPDGLYHYVNFYGIATRMELSEQQGGLPDLGGGVVAVPEPSTYGLLGSAACLGWGLLRRKRRSGSLFTAAK